MTAVSWLFFGIVAGGFAYGARHPSQSDFAPVQSYRAPSPFPDTSRVLVFRPDTSVWLIFLAARRP